MRITRFRNRFIVLPPTRMKVYACMLTGEEFFSDAKTIEEVRPFARLILFQFSFKTCLPPPPRPGQVR